MEKEELSSTLQSRLKLVEEMDTYQLFKDVIDNALNDANNESEFEDIVENSFEDYIDQANKIQNIVKGKLP